MNQRQRFTELLTEEMRQNADVVDKVTRIYKIRYDKK